MTSACLHTLLGVWVWSLLGSREGRRTRRTRGGTCIQYSWASCFPQSQAEKERCSGLPGDGRALGGSLINGERAAGDYLPRILLLGFQSQLHVPRLGMVALLSSGLGAGRGGSLLPPFPPAFTGGW